MAVQAAARGASGCCSPIGVQAKGEAPGEALLARLRQRVELRAVRIAQQALEPEPTAKSGAAYRLRRLLRRGEGLIRRDAETAVDALDLTIGTEPVIRASARQDGLRTGQASSRFTRRDVRAFKDWFGLSVLAKLGRAASP